MLSCLSCHCHCPSVASGDALEEIYTAGRDASVVVTGVVLVVFVVEFVVVLLDLVLPASAVVFVLSLSLSLSECCIW